MRHPCTLLHYRKPTTKDSSTVTEDMHGLERVFKRLAFKYTTLLVRRTCTLSRTPLLNTLVNRNHTPFHIKPPCVNFLLPFQRSDAPTIDTDGDPLPIISALCWKKIIWNSNNCRCLEFYIANNEKFQQQWGRAIAQTLYLTYQSFRSCEFNKKTCRTVFIDFSSLLFLPGQTVGKWEHRRSSFSSFNNHDCCPLSILILSMKS